jgi:hypothetical protein
MQNRSFFRSILFFIRSYFPLQLIFGHLKYNLFALSFWIFLFLIISDKLGFSYGIPFLFYSPEYNGVISNFSFALMGFAIGGFSVAFNTYSYMKLGKKYPFLATLSRPFIRFSLNNSIIPFLFSVYFIHRFVTFQMREEFASTEEVFYYALSYIGGFSVFVIVSLLYFFPINKDVHKILGAPSGDSVEEPIGSILHNHAKIEWSDYFRYQKDRSYIYMVGLFKMKRSRSIKHYDNELIKRVFSRNKINSSLFEIVTITTFIFIGVFRDSHWFEVPAAMSLVMLMTIILMLFSAFRSWFGYWTQVVLIAVVVFMNYMSSNSSWFQYTSYGYGLNYSKEKLVDFNLENITSKNLEIEKTNKSKQDYIQLLSNWKKNTGKKKPKLIILTTTGGGSRSTFWTFSVLQHVDQDLGGELSKHVHLMTGASGGMVGASYYRSLLLKDSLTNKVDRFDEKYRKNISKDLLNKLIFSGYSNDLFYRGKIKYDDQIYTKDRGYAFELQLHENTKHLMDVPMSYFKEYEKNAVIPTIVFTPTIVDNGRRLLISNHNLSFVCVNKDTMNGLKTSFENIDFQSYFSENNPEKLRFSSALRMSATFPFVLPMVTMPTQPSMHIMDAGLRDNYGSKLAIEMLYRMENWIKKNTSGVIFLQIRDTKKLLRGDVVKKVSLINKFTLPFGNMYDNFPRTQDYDQEQLLRMATRNLKFPVNFVSFNLLEEQKKRISLTWHLTSQEKARVNRAIYSRGNKYALYELKRLLRNSK